jgi:hypothetical protein
MLYQLVAGRWCPSQDIDKAEPVIIFKEANFVSSLYLIPREIITSRVATSDRYNRQFHLNEEYL